jgi:hypothetical protein
MRTEALGIAKEAHCRWPEGRSEQGASKENDVPPKRIPLPRGAHGRLDRERRWRGNHNEVWQNHGWQNHRLGQKEGCVFYGAH